MLQTCVFMTFPDS